VAFNASFSDPGITDTHTIAWDFGDGSEHLTLNSEHSTVSHVYRDNGEYDVTLTVTDDEGASTSNSFKVTVNNVAPTIAELTGDRMVLITPQLLAFLLLLQDKLLRL
jgi:PKD repeat protein